VLSRKREDKDPQDVQGNAVGYRLKKWSASAVGMKAEAFVKNETRDDERTRICEESDGNERQVGEREDSENRKSSPLRFAAKDQDSNVKQRKWDDVFAGDNAPELCVEWLAQRTEHGEPHESEHGEAESGNPWDLLSKRRGTQSDEENQDGERDSVGVERKKVWRPKEKHGHCGDVEDGRKG